MSVIANDLGDVAEDTLFLTVGLVFIESLHIDKMMPNHANHFALCIRTTSDVVFPRMSAKYLPSGEGAKEKI